MEQKIFSVTVEALKRTQVEVEATTEEEARKKLEKQIMEDGITVVEFDDMYDSVQVTHTRPLE